LGETDIARRRHISSCSPAFYCSSAPLWDAGPFQLRITRAHEVDLLAADAGAPASFSAEIRRRA
jgi:hypothetical protein